MRLFFAAIPLAFVLLTSCQSDQERSTDSLTAFTEAVVVHRAPYHAYALLDDADKRYVTMESWASTFDEREPPFAPGTAITVGDISIQGDRAESTVKITPPGADGESRKYVMRREGTKWRIWLGLQQLEETRKTLEEAQRLADDGALDLAREKVESVANKPFPASLPGRIEAEILVLRHKLGNEQRFARLDGRFTAAMQAELPKMKSEYEELAKLVTAEDETLYPRLKELEAELKKLQKQAALDGFEFTDVKAKPIRDAWGTYREVRFKTVNTTGRPLSKLAVRVELKNEGSDTPIGTVVWQLVEEGATLAPGAEVEVKREVEKAPDDWTGEQVTLHVDELTFADEAADDAG